MAAEIEAIDAALAQAVAAISRAQEEALGAVEHAKQIAMRAASAGYATIASQMNAIRQQIQTIHATLDGAATTATDAAVSVREVNDRMNPTEVTARLTAAVQKIDAMRGDLYAAVQQIAATSSNVQQVLRGGQPGPLLQRLDQVRQLAAIAAQRGDGAKVSINAAITNAGGLGLAGGESAGSAPGSVTPPSDQPVDASISAPVRLPEYPDGLPDFGTLNGHHLGRFFRHQVPHDWIVGGRWLASSGTTCGAP